jgi:hypothetical protein
MHFGLLFIITLILMVLGKQRAHRPAVLSVCLPAAGHSGPLPSVDVDDQLA